MNDKTAQLTALIVSAEAQGFAHDDMIRFDEWKRMGYRFVNLSPEAEIGQMAHDAFHELDDLPLEPISIKDTQCPRCAEARELIEGLLGYNTKPENLDPEYDYHKIELEAEAWLKESEATDVD